MRTVLLAVLMLPLTPALHAQPPQPATLAAAEASLRGAADRVVKALRGETPVTGVFAPDFLQAVPEAQLRALTTQFEAEHGRLVAVETVTPAGPLAAELALRFERAIARAQMSIEGDPPYRVTGLRITAFEPLGDTPAKLAADLAVLPGQTTAWFGPLDGRAPVLAHKAEAPLALGSTFKLYVLAALQRAVAERRLRWDQVVPLSARSFPSGLTQQWPRETPITLQALATLMIQISDNTATDRLIDLLGRDRIEAEMRRTNPAAARSLPFLTTREMFVIKADPALRARYTAANQAARRAMLAEVAQRDPSLTTVGAAFSGPPMAIESIEWFADAPSLARLLSGFTGPDAEVSRGILAANSGLGPDTPPQWAYIGFKGGSEPGVLNLTWLLQDKAGGWHMATIGWNNPAAPVDQAQLVALGQRMLALAPAPARP